jgi:hypothetical protein
MSPKQLRINQKGKGFQGLLTEVKSFLWRTAIPCIKDKFLGRLIIFECVIQIEHVWSSQSEAFHF